METFGKITLHNGDCMEVLKSLPDNAFDLAIVDPPYGIGANKMTLGNGKTKIYRGASDWDKLPPPISISQNYSGFQKIKLFGVLTILLAECLLIQAVGSFGIKERVIMILQIVSWLGLHFLVRFANTSNHGSALMQKKSLKKRASTQRKSQWNFMGIYYINSQSRAIRFIWQ